MTYIFVYGTLKTGLQNNYYLTNSEFVGVATTKDPIWHLVDVTLDEECDYVYPMMVKGGQARIQGEIYKVAPNILSDIDDLEDIDTDYKREPILLDNGQRIDAYIGMEHDRHTPFSSIAREIEHNVFTWVHHD